MFLILVSIITNPQGPLACSYLFYELMCVTVDTDEVGKCSAMAPVLIHMSTIVLI